MGGCPTLCCLSVCPLAPEGLERLCGMEVPCGSSWRLGRWGAMWGLHLKRILSQRSSEPRKVKLKKNLLCLIFFF